MVRKKKKTSKTQKGSSGATPSMLTWHEVMSNFKDRIFKIRSPRGHGTGFHIGNFGNSNKLCAIATAFHVVEEALDWGEPLKLVYNKNGKEILLKNNEDRAIFPYPKSDLAIIVFNAPDDLNVPEKQIELLDPTKYIKEGVDIGWCGFPGLRSDKLCFFHGYISAYISQNEGYLVDGVAINGVSGGPVFYINYKTNKPVVVGVITAYMANRTMKDTLPGVSMIASVSPYAENIKFLNSLSEVKKEAVEQKQKSEEDKKGTEDKSNLNQK